MADVVLLGTYVVAAGVLIAATMGDSAFHRERHEGHQGELPAPKLGPDRFHGRGLDHWPTVAAGWRRARLLREFGVAEWMGAGGVYEVVVAVRCSP